MTMYWMHCRGQERALKLKNPANTRHNEAMDAIHVAAINEEM